MPQHVAGRCAALEKHPDRSMSHIRAEPRRLRKQCGPPDPNGSAVVKLGSLRQWPIDNLKGCRGNRVSRSVPSIDS